MLIDVESEASSCWLTLALDPKTHDLMGFWVKVREHSFQARRLGKVHISRSPQDLEIGIELHECMNQVLLSPKIMVVLHPSF